MRIILFATLKEAQPTLDLFEAIPIQEEIYAYKEGKIIISGMGMLAACAALAPHLAEATEIINPGLAGALDDSLELGYLATIGEVSLHLSHLNEIDPFSQQLAMKCYPPVKLGEGPGLVTSMIPVHEGFLKTEMAKRGLLVDMEGYGVAYMARQANIPCTLLKIVSDFSRKEAIPLLLQNFSALAEKLGESLSLRS